MSNAEEPPRKYRTNPPPPPPSLSSLPDEIVVKCLALVPRSYHLSLSWVSKHLRALLRSPELNLHKTSLHVCLEEGEDDDESFHWFTLSETSKTREYGLVSNPTLFPPHKYGSATVALGSKIFFIGGSTEPSTDLWILDTRSGTMTQGPSMSVPREQFDAAVGVIDGKIYVIGGEGFHGVEEEESQVEVFDLKTETWEVAGSEKMRNILRCSASVEGKLYMVDYEETNLYNPRECERERLVHMVSEKLSEGGRKDMLNDTAYIVCVVEDILFAFFRLNGILWFDTKLSVWRRLVGRDGKQLPSFFLHDTAMAENNGRLVVLWDEIEVDNTISKNVESMLVSLDRSGDKICGTIDWSGIVATVPYSFRFLHCLSVSD
ncbi:unnamed protein product [Eruca vesicaria subsp. sativa]|uniref:F-box domain-containing protein n=1 Tax=Eruca vesicaria subsp. sativa TaxID=29727 RepID=A0ABC8LKV9_ERUVS|nr:unnamed protein product [Eruca vesicaria subsp. sativa]